MTFTEIVDDICNDLGVPTSGNPATVARIGRKVNQCYREVCSSINVTVATPVFGVQATCVVGVQTLTFSGIERIDRVIWDEDGDTHVLAKVTLAELRDANPGTDRPTQYAVEWMGPNQVRIRLNTLPQDDYVLKADGLELADELAGSQEPQFSSSYHDILIKMVKADELTKSEKATSNKLDVQAAARLSQLRLFIAQQAVVNPPGTKPSSPSPGSGGGGSVGSVLNGGTNWTQTGLVSYSRSPAAPFAVTSGSAVVDNLDADKLDGQHGAYYRDPANLSAVIPDAKFPATLPAVSGVNLTALNATQLTSGTVPNARFITTGTWTPSLGGDATYTTRAGEWVRIGNHIWVRGNMTVNVLGVSSVSAISGLPVAAAVATTGTVGYFTSLATNAVFLGCYVAASGTSVKFVGATAAAASVTDPFTTFGNGTAVSFTISYDI